MSLAASRTDAGADLISVMQAARSAADTLLNDATVKIRERVAVNGRIIWADVFASTDLLEKYWPKLVRSYASEAVVTRAKGGEASEKQAQSFLDEMEGRRETVESEPGIYRHTEINGDGFKAFALTSLLPKTGFDVHVAKMAE